MSPLTIVTRENDQLRRQLAETQHKLSVANLALAIVNNRLNNNDKKNKRYRRKNIDRKNVKLIPHFVMAG